MSALPRGLAAFCARHETDTTLWNERSKLRLKIDGMAIAVAAGGEGGLVLSHRLKPLPADSRDREALLDRLMIRVLARAGEQADAICIKDDDTLMVVARIAEPDDERVVTDAIEQFANSLTYWRQIVTT
jgi:hypothetical protein